MLRFWLAVFASSLCLAGVLRGDDSKKDLEKLQGTWQVAAVEIDGRSLPGWWIERFTFTFKGDELTEPDTDRVELVKLDASKKPKTIDAGKMLGIYRLDDDELTICVSEATEPKRPKEFKASKGSNQTQWTLRRVKK